MNGNGSGRQEIRLDDADLVAAAQILAWIARPSHPEHGTHLMEQWFYARRRFRREPVPPLPFEVGRRCRITSQLALFNQRLLEGFRAGLWFNRRCCSTLPVASPFAQQFSAAWGSSTRQMAKLYADRNGIEQCNAIRAIWSRRKPVLHLAWAAAEVLSERYRDEARRGFNLERTVFWPNWVDETIKRAERKADFAALYCGFPLSGFYRFHRDNI